MTEEERCPDGGCWWNEAHWNKVVDHFPPQRGDRVPCMLCGQFWVYTPGHQHKGWPAGWVPIGCDTP